MSRHSVSARRWFIRFGIGLLALITMKVAWDLRPLNATERKLVGTWNVRVQRGPIYLTNILTSDRKFKSIWIGSRPQIVLTGTWSASNEAFLMRDDIPWALKPGLLSIVRQWFTKTPATHLAIRSDDLLEVGRGPRPLCWERVSSEPAAAPADSVALPAEPAKGGEVLGLRHSQLEAP